MGVVDLEILRPRNGERFVDPGPVRLRARVSSDEGEVGGGGAGGGEGAGEAGGSGGAEGGGGLYFSWYSSLQASPSDDPGADVATADEAPLNGPHDDPLDFNRQLHLGTHVLSLSAKDVAGSAPSDLNAVTRAGMAGGADPDDDPCVVTVLTAEILEPGPGPGGMAPVLAGEVALAALAPARWGKDVAGDGDPDYEPDADYHEHNTVRYRWDLVRDGETEPALTWEADTDELEFDLDEEGGTSRDGPPRVRLKRALPGDLASGAYTLVLHVEDVEDPARWHAEDTLEVTVG